VKGSTKYIAGLALTGLIGAPALQAQGAEFSVGGGLAIPTGDYDNIAKVGWQGTAAVSFVPQNGPVGFRLDGTYSQFDLESTFDVHERFIYATGNVVYEFLSSEQTRLRPYLLGGLGVYNSKGTGSDAPAFGETSQTKFGLNAGAGVDFDVGGAALFVEGRFHNVFADPSSKQFIPITLGISFGG
jgi:opacity protein-like surface antigen